nr:DUF2637 domain-containing protein [Micromonospora sp. DSM 115978]
MTTPTLNSVYPKPVADLLPAARDLTDRLGVVPSRNQLMKELRVGAPKATALRDALDAEDRAAVDQPHPGPPGPAPNPAPAPAAPVPDPGTSITIPAGEVTGPPPLAIPVGHPDTNITNRRVTGRGWAYIGVILGGVVSIAANVAHTYLPKPPEGAPAGWTPDPGWSPSPLAVVFSVFWPVALFVAVEILTRVPWGDGARWFLARLVGVLPVALVAAVVSYRHLAGLLEHFGEDPLTVAIGPLAIDGLMVMASAALLATSRARTRR